MVDSDYIQSQFFPINPVYVPCFISGKTGHLSYGPKALKCIFQVVVLFYFMYLRVLRKSYFDGYTVTSIRKYQNSVIKVLIVLMAVEFY